MVKAKICDRSDSISQDKLSTIALTQAKIMSEVLNGSKHMPSLKERLLSAIEDAPDFKLEKLLMILESWDYDQMPQSAQNHSSSGTQETAYLLSIPGMQESILEGMITPVEDCDRALTW